MPADAFSYDEVPYISGARVDTHPNNLGALGRLFGLPTVPPEHARVLEIGCGDGGNLIPIAVSLPGAECLGFDLSGQAVARGRAAIEVMGLTNIDLVVGDIAAGPVHGGFDYIICHGVYSWIPAPLREQLLALIRASLRPAGVAFVSYNALPGGHIQQMLREMLRFHTRTVDSPLDKIRQARSLLALLERAPGAQGDAYRALLASQERIAALSSDHLLFHDDLAEINDPFTITEFVEAAGAHGLQFLAEAGLQDMSTANFPPEVASILQRMERESLLLKEQYLDFLNCRRFRETLLCHEEASLRRDVDLDRMRQFSFCCEAAETVDEATGETAFTNPAGSSLKTGHPATRRVLHLLAERYPRGLDFGDLESAWGEDPEGLAEVLFRTASVGLVGLRLFEPATTLDPGDRPLASPWARLRAPGGRVVNLYHRSIDVSGDEQALLPLLDGSRSAGEIAAALSWEPTRVREVAGRLARLGLLLG